MRRANATASASRPDEQAIHLWKVFAALAVFGAASCASSLSLPFVGDDYVFMDMTRGRSLWQVLALLDTHFGWYRPWSREIHFWVIQQLAGPNAFVFRTVGVALWVVALTIYFAVVRQLASQRVAVVAVIGVAALALWGTPLLWVSGSQDLWMLVWVLFAMLAFAKKSAWVLPLYALALLSKETAAVLPMILAAQAIFIDRDDWRTALRRVGPMLLMTGLWLYLHPTLIPKLFGPRPDVSEVTDKAPIPEIVVRIFLSLINLDLLPRPAEVDAAVVWKWVAMVGSIVCAFLWLIRGAFSSPARPPTRPVNDVRAFASLWAVFAWLPLLSSSIGWHAYYGCLGAMGAWVVIATLLPRIDQLLAALFALLTFVTCLHASTPSGDWGDEYYQRRAGTILSGIHDDLLAKHPCFPKNARVYLVHIPNNIGLIAGSTPAIRIWYGEPTLRAGFYAYFRKRTAADPPGEDFFFRMDSTAGMVEVLHGPEDIARAVAANPKWKADHVNLAVTMLRGGAPEDAAAEFEKVAQLPDYEEGLLYAAACWQSAGDTGRAAHLLDAYAVRTRIPRMRADSMAAELRANLPPPLPPLPGGSGF